MLLHFPQHHFAEPPGAPRRPSVRSRFSILPTSTLMVSGFSFGGLRARGRAMLLLCLLLLALWYLLSSSHAVRGKTPIRGAGPVAKQVRPVLSPAALSDDTLLKASPPAARDVGAVEQQLETVDSQMEASVDPLFAEPLDPLNPLRTSKLANNLPFFGPMPVDLVGPARERAIAYARMAVRLQNEADAALARASDAKAMVGIAADTRIEGVVDRYWAAHSLHFNESVQHAAAERIRDFLVPAEPARTPLCLISVYEGSGGPLPAYATALLDSISMSNPYASLRLFVHNVTRDSIPLFPDSPNVKVVDIAKIQNSYQYRGFAGLAADALCSTFRNITTEDGWELRDPQCALLEQRLRAFQGNGGSAIDQLRGHYTNIFAPWVNPGRCDSWGWIQPETVIGDLPRWMDNALINNADIVTAHTGDDWRLYLRNAFTVHSYRRNPELVSSLWKNCEPLSTLEKIVDAFARPADWLALAEGCYSHGALKTPGVETVMVPWQAPSAVTLILLYKGHLSYCVGETSSEGCRGWVKSKVREREARERKEANAAALAAAQEAAALAREVAAPRARIPLAPAPATAADATPLAPPPRLDGERTPREIFSAPASRTFTLPSIRETQCASWIPVYWNICLGSSAAALPERDWQGKAYVQRISTPANTTSVSNPAKSNTATATNTTISVSILVYELPGDFIQMGLDRGVSEALVIRYADANADKEKEIEKPWTLEQTWFYSREKGSIQIVPGRSKKILLHTLDGWW
ncbi:hypothetical protein BDK51DRAFT_49148 [Blyttiomyces helicus]|uniref:Uncharacterized protein n=1 Tax=Blyttiomyces helicus TaxID=388810 RepID=A0A4P9WD18_9FUNG|nr:hypothetical protein BDK51DRAFT_49148 [Blyttiomyces helicus]|eukprot:RKO88820.1 hypothetical protein BDK51DRAFT_49148 [Blyttiomyces helicus]